MTSPMSTQDAQQASIPTPIDPLHQRIAHATTEIQHCKQRLGNLLYDRATASAACADFETASRDAAEIQTLLPSSPLGFLCQGDIYRQQGRQTAAIEAYENGLGLSSSSSSLEDDHHHVYDQLQCNKKDAEYPLSKRIDFISQLPMEIVRCYILPKTMEDRRWYAEVGCPYLHVSRAWRERFLAVDGGLTFYTASPYEDNSELYAFVPYVGSLKMQDYHNHPDETNLFDQVDFSCLTCFDLEDYYAKDLGHLLQTLGPNSSSNLTHLRIEDLHGSIVRMADVLSSCPRLEELVIRYASTIDLTRLPEQLFPSLKVLRMIVQEEFIDHDNMLLLLKQVPSLEYLDIHPWQESMALTDIQQYCPSLKCLQYSSGGFHHYWDNFPMEHSPAPGLQCIQIHHPEITYYDPGGIDTLLKSNHTTLHVLDICVGTPGKEMDLVFPLLRRLVMEYRHLESNAGYGSWIPKYAPNIEELEVDMDAILKCSGLCESLKCTKNLRTLELNLGEQRLHPYHEHQLHHFLNQQIHMRSLELYIHPDTFNDEAWYTAIHNMPELRCLDLHIPRRLPHTFDRFMKGISIHCPLLEQLHVRCERGIMDEAIVYLVRLKRLKDITLPIIDMSRMAIISLGTLKTLKSIKVISGSNDDTVALDLLMEARRDIHIIASSNFNY